MAVALQDAVAAAFRARGVARERGRAVDLHVRDLELVDVGAMDTFIGPTTPEHQFIIGLKFAGKESARGSAWKLLPDGTYERHLDKYAAHPGLKKSHVVMTKVMNMPREEDED